LPSNLGLFLAFVSGFCFLWLSNVTRYLSQTWEGPRLIFWTGTTSVPLLALSRLIVLLLDRLAWQKPRALIKAVAPVEFSGTIAGAILLGIVLPILLNLVLSSQVSGWIASGTATRLHQLLYDLIDTDEAICVTLSDHKVYVGLVVTTPRLHPNEQYFEILPIRSGYREKDTGELRLTVDYSPLIQAVKERDEGTSDRSLEDFLLLLPFKDVISARRFDTDLFAGPLFNIKEVKAAPPVEPEYDPVD
jgi:hypothetical protein